MILSESVVLSESVARGTVRICGAVGSGGFQLCISSGRRIAVQSDKDRLFGGGSSSGNGQGLASVYLTAVTVAGVGGALTGASLKRLPEAGLSSSLCQCTMARTQGHPATSAAGIELVRCIPRSLQKTKSLSTQRLSRAMLSCRASTCITTKQLFMETQSH